MVRNCIAHAAGSIDLMRSPAKVRSATRQLEGFEVSGDDYIGIDKGVCEHLIKQASEWERGILKAANLALRVEETGSK